MSAYVYINGYQVNKTDYMFEQCRKIQAEVEQELISKAQELSDPPSKDYHELAEFGIALLTYKLRIRFPDSMLSSTPEGFVANTVLANDGTAQYYCI